MTRDPCGVFCVLLIYGSVIYADYVVIEWLLLPTLATSLLAQGNLVLFQVLLGCALVSHARTMFTDPGYVPIDKNSSLRNRVSDCGGGIGYTSDDMSGSDERGDEIMLRPGYGPNLGSDWTVCTRCESMRPPRAHHCRICGRCVRRMDHHCPWVNNCVGEKNQRHFLKFLLYVLLLSMHVFVIIACSWAYHDEHGSTGAKGPTPNAHHAKVLHTIFLSMEAALFGMFVMAVSCDQLQAVFNDETAVEAVQRRTRRPSTSRTQRRGRLDLLADVCASKSLLQWASPCSQDPRQQREITRLPRRFPQFDV